MATDAFARNPIVHEPTVTGIPPLRAYIRDIWNRRALIWHIARTDMKGEHYDTAIGQFWILLDPLLMAAVYYVVRSALRPGGAGTDRNMLLAHLIWGIFFFYATSKALQSGSRSITSNKGLILNAAFPKAVFPIVALLESVLDFIPTLAVYFIFHALLGQPFGMGMLALPLLIFLQLVFTFGLVLLFAPLTVFFRDTSGFMPYITRVWIYLTPVLYTTKEIPPNFKGWFHFNPLYPFFGALEQVFQGQWPSFAYVMAGAAWAVGMLLVGGVVFLVRERDFATRF
jgi:ABC-type polysaccharide/polyol phosphate export permease